MGLVLWIEEGEPALQEGVRVVEKRGTVLPKFRGLASLPSPSGSDTQSASQDSNRNDMEVKTVGKGVDRFGKFQCISESRIHRVEYVPRYKVMKNCVTDH